MQWLKQSTAAIVRIGPFVDDTDGKTAETGLTISQADIRLSKNGGNFAQTADSGGATHDENGWYLITLHTDDTDTLGRLDIAISETGALPVWREYMVLPAVVYNSLVAGSDYLQVDAVQVEGSDATDQINAQCDTAISDASLATAAAVSTVDTVVDAIKTKTDNLPADPADDSDIDSQLAAIAAYLDTEIAAILADTNELQTDDVPGLIAALNDLSAAQVNAEMDTALSDYDPPTKAELDTAVTTIRGADSDTLKTLSDQIDGISSEAGAGAITYTHTITSSVDSSPISQVDVWVTSDAAGNTVIASGETDGDGEVTFYLDEGTYYLWSQRPGYNFTNPTTITVS